MTRRSSAILILIAALLLTAGLSWFAVCNYRSASPIADDNLRGLALTIAAAMEGVAERDPSLSSLSSFQSNEIAYAMLISSSGKILFHSNPDLTGKEIGDKRYLPVLKDGILGKERVVLPTDEKVYEYKMPVHLSGKTCVLSFCSNSDVTGKKAGDNRYLNVMKDKNLGEERVRLGTGEYVYEFQVPFHLSGKTCVLRLALHTWSSEAVMRRARFGVALIFSLLAIGWVLGGTVFLLLRRQHAQEKQFARQHELARLGEVGAVLAHEVRNPLAGIKGYGQLLEERLPEGRDLDYAQLIVEESIRLELLVDDILLFTSSDARYSESGNLFSVVKKLNSLLIPQLETFGINMVVNITENINVHCREDGLYRILLNLLTNAIQALPDGGVINLSAYQNGDMVEIVVADNGTGIDAKIRSGLFEPFRSSKARGAGLGLAVCKKIVDSCCGSISVKDAPGNGTIFTVKLPSVQPEGVV